MMLPCITCWTVLRISRWTCHMVLKLWTQDHVEGPRQRKIHYFKVEFSVNAHVFNNSFGRVHSLNESAQCAIYVLGLGPNVRQIVQILHHLFLFHYSLAEISICKAVHITFSDAVFTGLTQVGQGATRSTALLVDLCWTYSAPWKCGLILDLF